MKKIAVVCARGLGDGLLSMILSHNLMRVSAHVTTFNTPLTQLKNWFPGKRIEPFPKEADLYETFSTFDSVIAADHSLVREEHDFKNELIIIKESLFDKKMTMAENLFNICREKISREAEKTNGITPLPNLIWKKHKKRVILHPTSSSIRKNWPASKFEKLANKLAKEGFEPVVCVSKEERKEFPSAPFFDSLDELAAFIYESGYMIGNDSGIGHLASNLGIPTLSLFARKKYSQLWRPGWSRGFVVTPPNLFLGTRLKQALWKQLLTPRRVFKAFKKTLLKNC